MPAIQKLDYHEPIAVIGDVHGDVERLRQLLRMVGNRPVVHCGDLCDRGPDSRGVIAELIGRGAQGVRGNHEEWLIALVNGRFDTFALHPVMGGAATLRSYGIEGRDPGAIEGQARKIPAAHADFLRALPVAMDLGVLGERYWVVHAGVPASVSLPRDASGRGTALTLEEVVPWIAGHKPDVLLWTHNPPETSLPVDRPVIMGHMPQRSPRDVGHCIAIDTGCGTCAPYELTALLLPERRFLTV